MKKLMLVTALCLAPFAANAQTVVQNGNVTIDNGANVRELPGDAYVVEGNNDGYGYRDGRGIYINDDDDSIVYHALVGRHRERYYNPALPGTVPLADVETVCATKTSVRDRNECIEDVMDERERLLKKHNR